jgi:hypothetical protein
VIRIEANLTSLLRTDPRSCGEKKDFLWREGRRELFEAADWNRLDLKAVMLL